MATYTQLSSILDPKQKKPAISQSIFTKAKFPGGRAAQNLYLETHLQVPAIAFGQNEGKEVIFGAEIIIRVNLDGLVSLIKYDRLYIQPSKPEVVRAVNTELNKFIRQMPQWVPATKDGKPVAALDTLKFIYSYAPDVTFAEYQKLREISIVTNSNYSFKSTWGLKTRDGKLVYTFVQSPPVYPGGNQALIAFLKQNLTYLQQKPSELVKLNLIINEKGRVEDIQVFKPKDIYLNPENLNLVLQKMPVWIPGKQNNQPIPVKYPLPIRY